MGAKVGLSRRPMSLFEFMHVFHGAQVVSLLAMWRAIGEGRL